MRTLLQGGTVATGSDLFVGDVLIEGETVALLGKDLAARIEPQFALFRPTMSKAVPWSGLVRMIGSPIVQFTA